MLTGQTWRECFDHDDRQRLVRAFTTTGTCAAGTPGTGTNPYNHTYAYSADGNLTRRVEGTTTINYSYPSAGAARPHAPTAVGGDSYSWTANGDLASRTVSGRTDTFTFDAERLLNLVHSPTGDTSFVYDADGARVLRRTPTGTTLYLDGHEITKPTSGSATAVRTYMVNGAPIAARGAGGVEFLATDNQGSVQLTVPFGATAPSKVRSYQPYGKPRTTDTTLTDRGWIGQFEDRSTALSYLNARYYDPVIGRFISPDPTFDPKRPQTINPYAYGLNSPTAFSDPSGLIPEECRNGELKCTYTGSGWKYSAPAHNSAPTDMCAPGSGGNAHPACVRAPKPPQLSLQGGGGGGGGGSFQSPSELEEAIANAENTLDVSEAGLKLCNNRGVCAKVTQFFEKSKLGKVANVLGGVGVAFQCLDTGLTSDECGRALLSEAFEYVPVAGQVWVVIKVLDIDLSKLPGQAKEFLTKVWHEFFDTENHTPQLTHDPEVVAEHGQPVGPSGSPNPNLTGTGLLVSSNGGGGDQGGAGCPLRNPRGVPHLPGC